MSGETEIRHAGLLARHTLGGWAGVLIEGPSGCGKSDLALRALDAGWSLVADDRVLIWRDGEALYGRAPDALSGLLEVRGLGVTTRPVRRFARIALLARCVQASDIERAPDVETETVSGLALPLIRIRPLEAAAPAKIGQALSCVGLMR